MNNKQITLVSEEKLISIFTDRFDKMYGDHQEYMYNNSQESYTLLWVTSETNISINTSTSYNPFKLSFYEFKLFFILNLKILKILQPEVADSGRPTRIQLCAKDNFNE